ncbi:hypothetical protein EB844_13110 [Paracoccus pantotrophus]|nr:hypothetical protein EB844_13110 [Paracoccus pantotrophus]
MRAGDAAGPAGGRGAAGGAAQPRLGALADRPSGSCLVSRRSRPYHQVERWHHGHRPGAGGARANDPVRHRSGGDRCGPAADPALRLVRAALSWIAGIGLIGGMLAAVPGSIDSIAILAIGTGADIAFAMSLQTLRRFAVVIVGPLIATGVAHMRHRQRQGRGRM